MRNKPDFCFPSCCWWWLLGKHSVKNLRPGSLQSGQLMFPLQVSRQRLQVCLVPGLLPCPHPAQCMPTPAPHVAAASWGQERRKECVQPVRKGKCIGNKKLNISCVWVMDCLSPAGGEGTHSDAFWWQGSHDAVINAKSAIHHVLCLWFQTLSWS